MTEFLNSLKADLLERRMLALLIALGMALVGAVAYAVLGGSAGTETPPSSPPVARSIGIAVTEAPSNPNQPVAETTNGSNVQRAGNARNPFAPVPAAKLAKVTTTSSSSTSSSSSSSSSTSTKSGSSTPSSGELGGSAPSKPTQPATPRVVIHYHVTALFGAVPPPPAPPAPATPAVLKSYENLTIDQPLPDKQHQQVMFLGVVLPAAKAAIFALTGEAILHGSAKCLPSASQCQAIELKPGQSETFETFDASNNPVTYELKLASITSTRSTASAAKAKAAYKAPSKAERELLRHAGLAVLPSLKGAQGAGMLVLIGHRPRHAHARSAAKHRRPAA
ncbi:MAG TPA: hypothetical protein VGO14_09920 [Solirubrobacteraceae bacterium]|jgi:hypothetical protein|nr:hypothetical protein [Solirubrobacteraceae bacterium]